MSTQAKQTDHAQAITPYARHDALGHTLTRYSPDGISIIEECSQCGARFLFQPGHEPVSLSPVSKLST